jgi:hypothetical protein
MLRQWPGSARTLDAPAGEAMTTLPPIPDVTIQQLIDRAHEAKREEPRHYLGVSELGTECERALWYSFRWALLPHAEGRMMRIWRTGHESEATLVGDLEAIGIKVRRQQEEISFGGHILGHIDGTALSVPGAEKTEHLLELKSAKLERYNLLEKKGVKEAEPKYWVQMQGYMLALGLTRALFVSRCKDDERLYSERVHFEREPTEAWVERGHRVSLMSDAPERIDERPSFYKCKMCDWIDLCHKAKSTDAVNCRTCAHSSALESGEWKCERWGAIIPVENQREGCPAHVLHPAMVRVDLESIGEQWHAAYDSYINGDPTELEGALSSSQLLERLKPGDTTFKAPAKGAKEGDE